MSISRSRRCTRSPPKIRTYFAYTEPEKARFLKEIGDKKFTIQRSKGLGENDPEMMWLTTMNPESRRLIKVLPTDVERTAQVFDLLLGDNLAGRKEHIAEHGAEYLDDLDDDYLYADSPYRRGSLEGMPVPKREVARPGKRKATKPRKPPSLPARSWAMTSRSSRR